MLMKLQIGDLLASITGEPGEPSPTFSSSNAPPKRKADDDLRRPVDKVQKPNPPAANSSRPITQSRPPALDTSVSKLKISNNGKRPSAQTPATRQPTTPASANTPKAPPKKGSFAEIMARAKVAQASLGPVGKIQHKKIEKRPSKRDIEEAKAQQSKNLKKGLERVGMNGKSARPGQPQIRDGKYGTKENGKGVPVAPEPEKKVKKAALATTGYAGTARPRPGTTKSSRPSSSGPRREEPKRYGNGGYGGGSSRRYTYASEEEDDDIEEGEEEEEEEDYDSASDMEAAAFEVDEEEEEAAKIARREDAEALAEENRLKREKEERKKRLLAMAKKARR